MKAWSLSGRRPLTSLKCVNSVYDTVRKVSQYIGLDSQSQGRYDHKDAQELIHAIFAPEANVNEISDDIKHGFATVGWQTFLDQLAQVKSDHRTHSHAADQKELHTKLDELTRMMGALTGEADQVPWKDELPQQLRASAFLNIPRVQDFLSVDKWRFADQIKAVDTAAHVSANSYVNI